MKILKGLAKYLDFDVSVDKPAALKSNIIPGNPNLDINALSVIFTGKNIDAKELRKSAWERKK